MLLEERRFPVGALKLLASARSAGQTQTWNGRTLTLEEVSAQSFEGVDLVLASAGGSVSKQWREAITAAGAVMVDNSSAFRRRRVCRWWCRRSIPMRPSPTKA